MIGLNKDSLLKKVGRELKSLMGKANASDYFDDISTRVDLTSLYRSHSSCYFDTNSDYAPVIFELKQKQIKAVYNDCDYLLQVWDYGGEKFLETALKNPPRLQAMCGHHLVYQPSEGDEDSDCLIVNFIEKRQNVKIRNFTEESTKYVIYDRAQEILIAASEEEIKIMKLKRKAYKKGSIDAASHKVHIIKPRLRIVEAFHVDYRPSLNLKDENEKAQTKTIFCFETGDFQLDPNDLVIKNFTDEELEYNFIQVAEVFPRERSEFEVDPIEKVLTLVEGKDTYQVTWRKSLKFDIYKNFQRTDSPNKYATSILHDQNSFGFAIGSEYYILSTSSQGNLTFAQANKQESDQSDKFVNWTVSDKVSIVTCYQLIKTDRSLLLVAHGKFVSVFNLETKEWERHTKYADDIMRMFKIKFDEEKGPISCVILDNGEIYTNIQDETDSEVSQEKVFLKIEGEMVDTAEDAQNSQEVLYLIVKETSADEEKGEEEDDEDEYGDEDDEDNVKYKLLVLYREKLHEITSISDQITSEFNIVTFKDHPDYLLVQKDTNQILLYKLTGKVAPEEEVEALDLQLVHDLGTFDDLDEDDIHTVVTYNMEEHLILIDRDNIYHIDIASKKMNVFYGEYIYSTIYISSKIMYAITLGNDDDDRYGLEVVNLEELVKNKQMERFLIKEFFPGGQAPFEADYNLLRMGYLESITHIVISPFLHLNTIKFLGIEKIEEYLTYKVIGTNFIALDKNNVLTTWDRRNGDLLMSHKLESQDFSNFDVHSNNKLDFALIAEKDDAVQGQDMKIEDYFPPWRTRKNDPNQITFLEHQASGDNGLKIKNWKLIEITGPTSVREVITFVHPQFPDQTLYFNKDRSLMIEKLKNAQVYLYKRVSLPQKEEWELVSKLRNYPEELDLGLPVLPHMSPDFTLGLQCDFEAKQFKIVDTLTNQERIRIPKDFLTFDSTDNNKLKTIMRRFVFVDNNTVRILSDDGIEKLLSFETGKFVELGFNKISLFTEDYIDDLEDGHYYYRKPKIDPQNPEDINQRLIRKYQDIKGDILLEKKTLPQIHDEIFSIDQHDPSYTEFSFNFLTWSLIEQIESGRIDMDILDEDIFCQVLYSMLPNGDTILSRLALHNALLEQLLNICHIEENGQINVKHYIPVLPNRDGKTAFHICQDNNEFKSLNLLLGSFKSYEVDHHSRFINTLYHQILDKDLPNFAEYISERFIQTQQLQQIKKGAVNPKSKGVMTSQLWFDKSEFNARIIKEGGIEERINCKIWDMPGVAHFKDPHFEDFFDALSQSENYNYFGLEPIRKIIDLNYPLVKKYSIYKLFIPYVIFICCYFYYFNFCLEFERDNKEAWGLTTDIMSVVVLLFATYFVKNEVTELYFEGIYYFASFWNYVDVGPAIGIYILFIIRMITKLSTAVSDGPVVEDTTIRVIQAATTWFVWFKFLYFFRLLKETGYLIRMIMEVIADMKNFIIVMLITIFAFGHATLILVLGYEKPEGSEDDPQFITTFIGSVMYTYEVILGGFDVANFQEQNFAAVYLLFLGCTIFNMIVMLNLLIAIISETFGKVNGNAENAAYQEMASIISENQYLVPEAIQESYQTANGFLLAVLPEQEKALDPNEIVMNKLKAFESNFNTLKTEISEIKELLLAKQQETPAPQTKAPTLPSSPKAEPEAEAEEEEEEIEEEDD